MPVTVVTAASGQYETQLMAEMGKTEAPTLFQVNGPVGLNLSLIHISLHRRGGGGLKGHGTSPRFMKNFPLGDWNRNRKGAQLYCNVSNRKWQD